METSLQPIETRRPKSTAALLQAKFLRVQWLVHESDYDAALEVLREMESTPDVLDLRARVEAQRGQYADAQVLWTRVLEGIPDHAGAKKGLREVQRATTRIKILRHVSRGAALLGLVGGGVLIGLNLAPEPPAMRAPTAAPSPAVVTAISAPASVASAAAPAPALPEVALIAGVSVSSDGGARIYSFEGGLFSEGVKFASDARERVTALGRALAPHRDAIQIELIGYVDTLPGSGEIHESTALALSRASTVLGRLARTTRIPAEDFVLRAVGQRLGPLSEAAGDPRNRTVQIRVSPR